MLDSKKQIPLKSVLDKTSSGDIFKDMSRLSSPKLQTLLINVFAKRVESMSPSDVLRQYKENRFVQPSKVDQRLFNVVDTAFFKNVDESAEVIELSPVAPVGANSIFAGIHQNNVISTVRNTEVMADTVTTMALECATRRQLGNVDPITLYTSQREIRAQKYEDDSGYLPHFQGMSVVSSYVFDGDEPSLSNALKEHLSFYLNGLKELSDKMENMHMSDIHVEISSMRLLHSLIRTLNLDLEHVKENARNENFDVLAGIDLPKNINIGDTIDGKISREYKITKILDYVQNIAEGATKELREKFPHVSFSIGLDRVVGMGYYQDMSYQITAKNKQGTKFQIASGGEVDWVKQLTQSKKERCVAGGMGVELLLTQFLLKK
ncbi:hypothetical protein COB18_02505 [Candidatus Kaiserbacteria bacterium]|nr:MAG: hypothetical protein COB18_02505 [Candidatus Kaiserbacteria bacterium]